MYDLDTTETSKRALVELCRALRQYRNDMVLAGGARDRNTRKNRYTGR